VLPQAIRRKLGLRTGDTLEAEVKGGVVTLTPQTPRARKTRIVKDPLTGLPVLNTGADSPTLTSEAVRSILEEFP